MPHRKRFEELLKEENVSKKIDQVVQKIRSAHVSAEMESLIASRLEALRDVDDAKKAEAKKKLGDLLKAMSEGITSRALAQQIAMTIGDDRLKHVTADEIMSCADAMGENYTPEKMGVFIDRYIEMIIGNGPSAKSESGAERPAVSADSGTAAELARLKALADDYMNSLIRMKADFDNYKKRVIREKEEYKALAFERFFTDLLATLDSFDAIKPDSKLDYEGVQKIGKLLFTTMSKYSLTEIETSSAFDANVHQALTTEERSDVAEHTILETFRKGYRLGEKVIRPALVKVAVSAHQKVEAENNVDNAS